MPLYLFPDTYWDAYDTLPPDEAPPPPAPELPNSPLIDDVWLALPRYIPLADDGTLYAFLASATAPVDTITDLLESGGGMVDPATVPAPMLPWVAALAGVDLSGVPAGYQRAIIADPISRNRGNVAAIAQRVGLTLTGSRTVQIECPLEGDELAILVRTFTPETPDATATEAAARIEVPAWLVLTYESATGVDYDAIDTLYDDYDDMTTDGGSYADLANTQP